MKNYLDRKLQFVTKPNSSSLYSWAINEIGGNGQIVGDNEIPWMWDLRFTATEIVLSDDINVNKATENDFGRRSFKEAGTTETHAIRAKLRPGHPRDDDRPSRQTTYRMFGTDRVINDFTLFIYRLKSEDQTETCYAWGVVKRDDEIDFRKETQEDCVGFNLEVKPSTFDRYAARISIGTADELILTVGSVAGFYSAWLPSISTNSVKVLTGKDAHELLLPSDAKVEPPRLGFVGNASVIINAIRTPTGRQSNALDHLVAEEKHNIPNVQPEASIVPKDLDPHTMDLLKSIKGATRWIIGLLVVLVIATIFKR